MATNKSFKNVFGYVVIVTCRVHCAIGIKAERERVRKKEKRPKMRGNNQRGRGVEKGI